MPKNPELNAGEILIAEYEYIAQAIFQANEDRSRVASFYMVSFGSFIAALVTYQFNITPAQEAWIRWGFVGLFMALALMGVLTILQLARLRHAWFEGLDAMNQVKDYYIAHFNGLKKAFAWSSDKAPRKFKPGSVGFIMVIQIAAVGGVSFGSAVIFATLAVYSVSWPLLALLSGIAFCFFQVGLYWWQLRK
jgi:hypothetical protein